MKKATKLVLMYLLAFMLVFTPSYAYALTLSTAEANDVSKDGDGVDSGDTLVLTFDEGVFPDSGLTTSTIDDFFTLSDSHSWGTVSTLSWTGSTGSGSVLTVAFGSGSATIDKTDTLTPKATGSYVFEDSDGIAISTSSATIIGTFDREWDEYDDSSYIDEAQDIFVDGDYAYVAAGQEGLFVLDVSNQDAMTAGGDLDFGDEDANAVYVEDDYAYVCAGSDGLYVVDVSDPDDLPSPEENSENTDGDCLEVFADSEYVYVADGDNGLAIFEIDSDDVTEVEAGFEGDWGGDVVDVFVDGNYAYLAVDDADNGLVIVDVSSPSDLTDDDVLDTIETEDAATGVFVDDDYAYVSIGADGLQVFDISDPEDIQDEDNDDMVDDTANAVYYSDRYAFIADGDAGIKVSKVTSGSIASSTSEDVDFDLGSSDECTSIFVDDGWAYLTCEGTGVFSINVDDISSSSSGDGPDYTDGDLYVYAAYDGDDEDGTREAPYTTIQDAIDAADTDDEIFVFPGTYEEEITIDVEGLQLTGVGPSFVTIRGDGDAAVTIEEDDVEFKGFTVSEGDEGIYVKSGNDVVIKNNVIIDTNDYAIHVDDVDTDVVNNTIVQNDGSGLYIEGNPTMDVRNNIFTDNESYGIEVEDTDGDDNVTEQYNLFNENDYGNRSGINSGTGDRTGDPDFDDEDDDDYEWEESGWLEDFYLDSDSNAEDYGDSSSSYDDNDGSRNDMGAFGGPDAQYDDGDSPDDPEDLEASADGLVVTLDWDDNAEGDLFGYYIERSTSASSGYSQLNDEPVIGSTYEDTTPSADTYYYRVTAVDLFEEESDATDETSIDTSGTTTTPVTTSYFSDVPASHEFAVYVNALKAAGIIGGFGDGTFKPLRNVTRAEFLKMALNAANIDSSAYASQASCFSDMVSYHPLKQYVCYAYANGYVSGSGGMFYPEREITRFEAMKILLNVNAIADITATTSIFSDVVLAEQIRYIQKGYELGLVGGYTDGTFRPNNNILRQESAKIVSKMRDL